jgi:hypothetical protein
MTRILTAVAFLAIAATALGAKCLENGGLQFDPDGKPHLYGEIHNETDVQGLDIELTGVVFDVNGNELASNTAIMCPGSLSPGTFSVYDILVDTPGAIASHRVNVTSGTASSDSLPALGGTFGPTNTIARYNAAAQDYELDFDGAFTFTEPAPTPLSFTYCVALYNSAGRVIGLLPHLQVFATTQILFRTTDTNLIPIPGDATTMRFIAWRGTPASSLSAPAISDPVTINWD